MKLKSFILIGLVVLMTVPFLAHAVTGGNTGGGGLPNGSSSTSTGNGGGGGGGPQTINLPNPLSCDDAQCLIVKIFKALWILASLLTTLMVLVGAFQILTSAGSVEKVETGKRTITYAVIGFVVVMLSWSITAILKSVFDSATQ